MGDYLTLAQLEESLDRQSFYIGCMELPQQVIQYSFNDIAEAPLIEKRSTDTRPTQTYQEESRIRLSHLANQSNPAVVDGVIHPAFREPASHPIPSIMFDKELPPIEPQSRIDRLTVLVPTTK